MRKTKYTGLPINTIIEVVSVNKEGKMYKTEMSLAQAQEITKKDGWKYSFYQLGFSAYDDIIEIKI